MDINTIIIRVLTGECTSDDMSQFLDWINSSPSNKEEFEKIKSYWNSSVSYNHHITAEESFNKTLKRIHKVRARKQKVYKIFKYSLIAASFAICFALGSLVQLNSEVATETQYICLSDNSMSTYYMADSTKIILNRHSKLVYTDDFGVSNRKVKLEGEAYFEVTKNKQLPFIVDMGDASIKVLGTKFTVRNRINQETIKAVLIEGSIRFSSSQQKVQMIPDQQLLYNKKNNQIEDVSKIDSRMETSWKEGLLRFKSELLPDILHEISHFYNVEFVLSNRVSSDMTSRFSASFETSNSVNHILRTLKKSIDFTWYEKDGKYYIN